MDSSPITHGGGNGGLMLVSGVLIVNCKFAFEFYVSCATLKTLKLGFGLILAILLGRKYHIAHVCCTMPNGDT